jgi:methionyl-tRNA formyltransferase
MSRGTTHQRDRFRCSHRMTSEFDQGPVLAQREIVIADDEDGDDVLLRMEQFTPEVMEEAFDQLAHPIDEFWHQQ